MVICSWLKKIIVVLDSELMAGVALTDFHFSGVSHMRGDCILCYFLKGKKRYSGLMKKEAMHSQGH